MVRGKIILSNGRRHFGRPSRSNPIRIGKGLAAKVRQLEHERRPVGVNGFFFLSAGGGTLLHEEVFLHIKGIKTFGYEIVTEKELEKISKLSKK